MPMQVLFTDAAFAVVNDAVRDWMVKTRAELNAQATESFQSGDDVDRLDALTQAAAALGMALDAEADTGGPNPIAEEFASRRYPGWAIRIYADGTIDAGKQDDPAVTRGVEHYPELADAISDCEG